MRGEFSPATKQIVVVRQDGACCVCGIACIDTLDFHPLREYSFQHRRARGMGGSRAKATTSPANALLSCGSATTDCHHRMESRPAWAEGQGYRVDQGVDPTTVPVWCFGVGWVLLDDFGGLTTLDVPFAPEAVQG